MKKYLKPELDILVFTQSENITTSSLGGTDEEIVDPFGDDVVNP